MFTGIIQAIGSIVDVEPLGDGARLTIRAPQLGLQSVQIGDSIAVNGACMTVVDLLEDAFKIEVSAESLSKTSHLNAQGEVNLEKAMRVGDRLDGHIVSGHVDGVGVVEEMTPVAESWRLVVRAPAALGAYLAYKGSVTINGVSLTVNSVQDSELGTSFSINLIPHTVEVTTLKHLKAGDRVNVEVDTIARYVERMISVRGKDWIQ